jgi:tetratricopeptide (TPR) repeat protein
VIIRDALAAVLLLLAPFSTLAQYGPYDYTNALHYREYLPVVEQFHFNRDIETLRQTMDGGTIGGHLWYVIRAFPNHHRALNSMAKLWRQHMAQNLTPLGLEPDKTPEFLFNRAMQFAPHDGVVPLVYGIHLLELGERGRAIELFERADELGPDNAELQYNLGLMYLKLSAVDQAALHARRAYALNYPLQGLRNKLIELDAWNHTVGNDNE